MAYSDTDLFHLARINDKDNVIDGDARLSNVSREDLENDSTDR